MSRKKRVTNEGLSDSLEINIQVIKSAFINDDTLRFKEFENETDPNIKFCIFFIDGMVSNEMINDDIIRPIINNRSLTRGEDLLSRLNKQVIISNQVKETKSMDDIINAVISGDTVLFVGENKEALIISTKDFQGRAIEEPVSEKVLRGPREGFTESMVTNLTLIRRKLQKPNLKIRYKTIGENTNTQISVCYLDGITNQKILDEVFKRLDFVQLDSLLDSNYIQEYIKDSRYTPFKTVGSTERPDVVAGKLLEGRIAILIEGSPVALTIPHLFIEHIQSNDDYYINFYFSSIGRLLRLFGFITTISISAIYLSLVSFHQEIIPTELLLSIYAARQSIPFPTVIELLALLFVFEILREAGIRMPSQIGQALSIVGALVLGQAAVEARFVSAPIVIVVGLSGITSLMVPRLTGASIIIRLLLIGLSSLIGLYGFIFGISAVLIHLFDLKSFGVPFMSNLTSYNVSEHKDTLIRAPWWALEKNKPNYLDKNFRGDGDE